jgi:hypothetical protein
MSFFHAHATDVETANLLRLILNIPEESYFFRNWGKGYSLAFIREKQDLQARAYQAAGEVVWALLRLVRTHELKTGERRAGLHEALSKIVGTVPLKSPGLSETNALFGEKAYAKHFKTYKALSPFLGALEMRRQKVRQMDWTQLHAETIKNLLGCAKSLRAQLLSLRTPNVKKKNRMFVDEDLCTFPAWIPAIEASVPPFPEPLETLRA